MHMELCLIEHPLHKAFIPVAFHQLAPLPYQLKSHQCTLYITGYLHVHIPRPAQAVRPVWLWPCHFSTGKIKQGRRLIGVADFKLDMSAVVRRTAHSSVCLTSWHRILTTIPKHSTFWNRRFKKSKLFGILFNLPTLRGLFRVAWMARQLRWVTKPVAFIVPCAQWAGDSIPSQRIHVVLSLPTSKSLMTHVL